MNINLDFPFPEQSLVTSHAETGISLWVRFQGVCASTWTIRGQSQSRARTHHVLLQEAAQGNWIHLKVYFSNNLLHHEDILLVSISTVCLPYLGNF